MKKSESPTGDAFNGRVHKAKQVDIYCLVVVTVFALQTIPLNHEGSR